MKQVFATVSALLVVLATTSPVVFAQSDLDALIDNLHAEMVGSSSVPPIVTQDDCGQGQRCVLSYLCSNASTTGEGLIDERMANINPCGDDQLMCCYEEDIIHIPPTSPPRPTPTPPRPITPTPTPPAPITPTPQPITPTPTPPQGGCGQGQRCVLSYLCSNASTTGEGLIDERMANVNPCGDDRLMCCYEEDIIHNPPTSPPRPTPTPPVPVTPTPTPPAPITPTPQPITPTPTPPQPITPTPTPTAPITPTPTPPITPTPTPPQPITPTPTPPAPTTPTPTPPITPTPTPPQPITPTPKPPQPITPTPTPPVVPPVQQSVCGRRNTEGIAHRMAGSNETEYGEFPWMMAVLKQEAGLFQDVFVYRCGGSLIHPRVVLTGAHCVQRRTPAQLRVRGGEWDTQSDNEFYPYQDRNVAEIIVHPEYYKAGLHNDVALLIMDTPFELNQVVQPVCLPPQDAKFDHQRCFVSGWGKDEFGKEGSLQAILKQIDVPIVPSDQCQSLIRTTPAGPRFVLHNSFICAGGERGKATCDGDGGSPLVCQIPGSYERYYQVGLDAWGLGCGDNEIPELYADVAHVRNWIDEQMQARQIDTGSYTP